MKPQLLSGLCAIVSGALFVACGPGQTPDAGHVTTNAPVRIDVSTASPSSPITMRTGSGCSLTLTVNVVDADITDRLSPWWTLDGTIYPRNLVLPSGKAERAVVGIWQFEAYPQLRMLGSHTITLTITDTDFDLDGGVAPHLGLLPDGGPIPGSVDSFTWTVNAVPGDC